MRAYRIKPGSGIEGLELFEAPAPDLGAHEVRVRIRAVSLNYRDLMVARGTYPVPGGRPVIPCSDGAGEVLATGSQVTRFKAGDRAAASFFPNWIDGEITPEKTAVSLGGAVEGMLSEEVVLPESALAAIPARLDFAEAATLPCAGVTAWNALFAAGSLKPGSTVLLLGTGGVSIMAQQLAMAAGMRIIVTSSDNEKLARARALGAGDVINHGTNPEWQEEVLRLTSGRGVDLVVEVGGEGTAQRSAASTRAGGTIAIIGGVSGFGNALPPGSLIFGAKRALGIFVGSRAMLEDLTRFVDIAGIRPAVDRVFAFEEAHHAYAYLEAGKHFGKIVITVG